MTTIQFTSERGQGFIGFISHLMIVWVHTKQGRAPMKWKVWTAIHHKPQFTCSFVASGAAGPFLGVLIGVTWATRKEKQNISLTSVIQKRTDQLVRGQEKVYFNWRMSHFIKKQNNKKKNHPSGSATSWPQSWCNGKRNTWFQIKQKAFFTAVDIGPYDELAGAHWGSLAGHIQYMRCHCDRHCVPEMA